MMMRATADRVVNEHRIDRALLARVKGARLMQAGRQDR